MTDPIADYLTRLRNAISAGHKVVDVPGSKMKREMTKILKEKGYILNYKFEEDGAKSNIKIALKYNPETKKNEVYRVEKGKDKKGNVVYAPLICK